MKIHPVGAELFHAEGQMDGRTDMMKLTVAFHNFANMPKNCSLLSCLLSSMTWHLDIRCQHNWIHSC